MIADVLLEHGAPDAALQGADTFQHLLERGMAAVAAVDPEGRAACAIAVAETWRPTTDLARLGIMLWTLDHYAGRHEEYGEKARSLKRVCLGPLWEECPPPSPQDLEDTGAWQSIPGGTFIMGTPAEEGGGSVERPQHRVKISAFRLQSHPVTYEDHTLKVGRPDRPDLPIVQVTWYEAYAYAAWLGGRLPTEAEWEYACRAGSRARYSGGKSEKALDRQAWYLPNADRQLQPVQQKAANAWGLYDMHGNVWEWVADWFGPYEEEEQKNPLGPAHGPGRVVRGGCVRDTALWLRSGHRKYRDPGDRDRFLGFRVVL